MGVLLSLDWSLKPPYCTCSQHCSCAEVSWWSNATPTTYLGVYWRSSPNLIAVCPAISTPSSVHSSFAAMSFPTPVGDSERTANSSHFLRRVGTRAKCDAARIIVLTREQRDLLPSRPWLLAKSTRNAHPICVQQRTSALAVKDRKGINVTYPDQRKSNTMWLYLGD